MRSQVEIRFASIEDAEWCIENDHYAPAAMIRRKINFDEILLAERKGQPVGYLRLEYLWSKIPYVALIFVIEGQQKQGIGRALITWLEVFLRSKQHTFLLSSVQLDSPAAQEWHRKIGFEECGILNRVNRGGIGEVFFRKSL